MNDKIGGERFRRAKALSRRKSIRLVAFVIFMTLFIGSQLIQTVSPWGGLVLAQATFVGAASFLVLSYQLPIRKAFYLRKVSWGVLLLSIFAGVVLWFLAAGLTILLSDLGIVDRLSWPILQNQLQNQAWLARLLLIGLLSVVGEEMFFRGSFLYWYATDGRMRSLWVTSFVFAIIHPPINMFGALLLGLLCGSYVLRWESILPALLIHFAYNIIAPWLLITLPLPATTLGWGACVIGALLILPLQLRLLKGLSGADPSIAHTA